MGIRIAAGIVGLWVLLALAGPWLAGAPDVIALERILAAPGMPGCLLGCDDLGRPLLDRLLAGARVSLVVALASVAVSALLGTALGLTAGYAGGLWDALAMRVVDVFLAFPGILLAIALAAVLGPGVDNVIVALVAVGWTGYARLARAQALTLRAREHVLAAAALGAGPARIVLRHVLPLALAPLLVEATFGIAAAVVAEAGLSFLGLGVQPPQASWGAMIRDGVRYLLVAPHAVLVPGAALAAVVLAVNMLGDHLRDRLDVRLREAA